jgi:teichuronic acid biosynthesis glycosyltransferase TuaC
MMEMTYTKMHSQENLKDKTLLIITPSFPNEDESFFVELFVKYQVAELKQYFKKIIVIAPLLRSFGYLKKDRLCKDYIYDNVEVYYPRCLYIPVFWLSKILIDNRLQAVERTIEKHHLHFDLIHAHFTWPSGYIGVKLKEKNGKPVIITIHEDCDWFNQEVGMEYPPINAAWTGANALIRVNNKDIPILKIYNENVYGIPNGFSPAFHPIDTSHARKQLGLPQDVKIIFTLGYLTKRKGFNYLIDVMEQIRGQRDDVLCFIGGTGTEEGSLQEQINQLHLGDRVKLLGSVPGDQLTFWMNSCDLFALPSLNEGNPTVMFEALGCGKPFVGTNVGGVPEIIISDAYGLLVKPADPKDLEEKILMALNRKWDREVILTYAVQFTWENIAKEIIGVYEQILR